MGAPKPPADPLQRTSAGEHAHTGKHGSGGADAIVEHSLVIRLALLARQLRARGVKVDVGDQIDAAQALRLIDIGDVDEVYLALRTVLKIDHGDWSLFKLLFHRLWRRATDAAAAAVSDDDPFDAARPPEPPRFELRRRTEVGSEDGDGPDAVGDAPGYNPEALLRRKSFDECTPEDLVAMEQLLGQIARRLATRRSRRLEPAIKGHVIDLRRSFRRSLAGGGELFDLARRRRTIDAPDLVLLCDTSGSMDPHSRFLLAFVLSLRRVARQSEAFAFNTRLTRLTPWLTSGNLLATLERLARHVEDWSGGTRIGACLLEFVDRFLEQTVSSHTTVIILSDGLDRGETEDLEAAMLRIRRRARRVIWLNPLLGDARYRPEARGMKAALPYVDDFLAAHNLESLEALLPLLAA